MCACRERLLLVELCGMGERFGLLFLLNFFLSGRSSDERLSEPDRIRYWNQHHQWPPQWQIESEGYENLMRFREQEIMSLTGADERWENWMQFVQSRLVPKFTPKGFEVVQTPPHIATMLHDAVSQAIEDWDHIPSEGVDDVYNKYHLRPKFASISDLANRVHQELKHLHEEWAGISLQPTRTYGVRLYQNGSSLVMHLDKPTTHVISSIVHIAHDYDDESQPWSIDIEDHDGELHSVFLEEGQMLFYESAKCLHGRMTELKGKYYGSLFLHYQPVDTSIWNFQLNDIINAVPPHWRNGLTEPFGSRWAGQAITTDSRVVFGAPERKVGKENPRNFAVDDNGL